MLRDITQAKQICRKEAESGFNILLIADTHLKTKKMKQTCRPWFLRGRCPGYRTGKRGAALCRDF